MVCWPGGCTGSGRDVHDGPGRTLVAGGGGGRRRAEPAAGGGGRGPLLGDLRADTGLSSALGGLLTSLPVLCFGAFAPVAPRLARKVGLETAVAASLVLLAVGTALRLLTPVGALYGGTVVAGGAIAVANVLVPAYVKREFAQPGLVMGVYSAALNIGAALAAGLTVPLGRALGLDWRDALAMWGVLAVLALAVWLPVAGTGRAARGAVAAPGASWGLLRHDLGRRVTLFLGMQSTQFYGLSAWLPTLLTDAGLPTAEGGLLLAVATVTGAVGAFLAPTLAGRLQQGSRGSGRSWCCCWPATPRGWPGCWCCRRPGPWCGCRCSGWPRAAGSPWP
ncbi:MFS transporter [Klenkia terrae]|uniref:MFS transporter n=1 Tax=Klenkia terrae TaxID=1052259 RepID=UPI00360AEFB4